MKGIILNSEQVNTILETGILEYRKAIKLSDAKGERFFATTNKPPQGSIKFEFSYNPESINDSTILEDPFGELGDKLFVKESFCKIWNAFLIQQYKDGSYYYKASWDLVDYYMCGKKFKWKPATNMRQDQSRLTVEITDIKVEKADVWEWVVNLKLIK